MFGCGKDSLSECKYRDSEVPILFSPFLSAQWKKIEPFQLWLVDGFIAHGGFNSYLMQCIYLCFFSCQISTTFHHNFLIWLVGGICFTLYWYLDIFNMIKSSTLGFYVIYVCVILKEIFLYFRRRFFYLFTSADYAWVVLSLIFILVSYCRLLLLCKRMLMGMFRATQIFHQSWFASCITSLYM